MQPIPDAIIGLPAGLIIILLVDYAKTIYDPGKYAGLLALGIAFAVGFAYLALATTQPYLTDAGEALAWGLALPVVKATLLAPLADATNAPGKPTPPTPLAGSPPPAPHG